MRQDQSWWDRETQGVWEEKRRLACGTCILFPCMMVHAHFPLCNRCRCESVLRIKLVLIKISVPLVAKGLRN